MTATTQPNVRVTADGWTQISSADMHVMQVLYGKAGIIYAPSEPGSAVRVGEMGHVLEAGEFLMNNTGGTAWGRADAVSKVATISVTEG